MKWNNIKNAMHEMKAETGAESGEADAFWNAFRARAALVNQEKAGEASDNVNAPLPNWHLRIAMSVSCLALVAIISAIVFMQNPTTPVAPPPIATRDTIHELSVQADHDGKFILVDQTTNSTIVWIAFDDADSSDTH